MTEKQAQIIQLRTRIELLHFALAQTRSLDHELRLRRAIRSAEQQIHLIEVGR